MLTGTRRRGDKDNRVCTNCGADRTIELGETRELGAAHVAQRPLIEKLAVQNFGCLRSVEVDFGPLTVLVGPNDSGKTMLLRAIETLATSARIGQISIPFGSFRAATFNQNGKEISLNLKCRTTAGPFTYEVAVGEVSGDLILLRDKMTLPSHEIHADHEGESLTVVSQQPRNQMSFGLTPSQTFVSDIAVSQLHAQQRAIAGLHELRLAQVTLLHAIRHATVFRLVPARIRERVSFKHKSESGAIETDGFGVAKVVAELLLGRRELLTKIEDALHRAMPFVKQVHAEQDTNGNYLLKLQTSTGGRIDAQWISDGVLFFLTYLLLVMGPEPRPLLMVEEPELGIHPGLLERLITFLRQLSQGVFGEPVQVILTTHSPVLLNYVEPEEIRVVQRQDDGGAKVSQFKDAPDVQRLLEYQGPGEIWVNMTESYLTGGAPAQ